MSNIETIYNTVKGFKLSNDAEGLRKYVSENGDFFKATFKKLLAASGREDVNKITDFLETTDFYEAPCSTKYHLCCKHGLVLHSLLVTYLLLAKKKSPVWGKVESLQNTSSLLVIGLLHDVCKTNFYTVDYKNQKVYKPNGSKEDAKGRFDWETLPFYTCDDKYPLGHGEKSVIQILKTGFKLTDEEICAIRWHMGFSNVDDKLALGNAFKAVPLTLAISEADMESTYLIEQEF